MIQTEEPGLAGCATLQRNFGGIDAAEEPLRRDYKALDQIDAHGMLI